MSFLDRSLGEAFRWHSRRQREKHGPGVGGLVVDSDAPDFELMDSAGRRVRLADHRGRDWILLVFYPADDTPG